MGINNLFNQVVEKLHYHNTRKLIFFYILHMKKA